jgi:large subunit ribosomal protein L25
MANSLQIGAVSRIDVGKGASRRLRHANKVPAIVYGAGKKPQMLTLQHNEVIKALENEEFFSQIITLTVDEKAEKVVLKDLQRHAFKPKIMHMDFLRIKADEAVTMLIPLHFIDEEVAPGVKQDGGTISHALSEVEVKCLPADLPKYIEVDMSKLELNDTIHLSDLKLPHGVEIPVLAQGEEYDQLVASLHLARMAEEIPIEEEVEEVEGEEEVAEGEEKAEEAKEGEAETKE